jgi:DNA-binding XRE family transcriptional regulator
MGAVEQEGLRVPKTRLPRILSVRVTGRPLTLFVEFDNGMASDVDVGAFLKSFAHFAPLIERPSGFSLVALGEFGTDIVWPGGIEMSSESLLRLLREQTGATMAAGEFREWRQRNRLTLDGAAKALGISRRMVAYYEEGRRPIPRVVALATKSLEVG